MKIYNLKFFMWTGIMFEKHPYLVLLLIPVISVLIASAIILGLN